MNEEICVNAFKSMNDKPADQVNCIMYAHLYGNLQLKIIENRISHERYRRTDKKC